jgi:vacuolar-type H+-ATPase subunit H
MFSPVTQSEPPPLDLIRKAEAEATRRIAEARQIAEQSVNKAKSQAKLLRIQAREEGQRDGQARYQETIVKAEEEADAIIAFARKRAEVLRLRGELRMDVGVSYVINLILGQEEEAYR